VRSVPASNFYGALLHCRQRVSDETPFMEYGG
jgi:hypothetical protein